MWLDLERHAIMFEYLRHVFTTPRGRLWPFALSVCVILLDQLAKQVVIARLAMHQAVDLVPGLRLVCIYNKGAAFSFLSNEPGWQRWFFIMLAAAMTALLSMWILRRTQQGLHGGALGLVLGGALGNGIDRIVRGHVVDFIDFYVGNWHWPAFNIADSAIVVGVGLLLWRGLDAAPRVTSAKGSRP